MFMGLHDVLKIVKTEEERERIKESFIKLLNMTDDDVDYSDDPPSNSNGKVFLAKPYLDKMREHNRKIREQKQQQN